MRRNQSNGVLKIFYVPVNQVYITYDFFLYQGASTGKVKCNGDYVVKKLCETLPRNKNHKLMFDNWFTSLNLCIFLKEAGIFCTATICSNRMQGCPLSTDKDLQKRGRGNSSFRTDANSGLVLLKWFDNKCVQMVSTFSFPESTKSVKRWDHKNKKYVDVLC